MLDSGMGNSLRKTKNFKTPKKEAGRESFDKLKISRRKEKAENEHLKSDIETDARKHNIPTYQKRMTLSTKSVDRNDEPPKKNLRNEKNYPKDLRRNRTCPADLNSQYFKAEKFPKLNGHTVNHSTHVNVGAVGEIMFGSKISIQSCSRQQKQKHSTETRRCKVPECLLVCQDRVTEEMMHVVRCGSVGKSWRKLGYYLGLSSGTMDILEFDHHLYGLNEIVFQTLINWQSKLGNDAVVSKLVHALQQIGRVDLALQLMGN